MHVFENQTHTHIYIGGNEEYEGRYEKFMERAYTISPVLLSPLDCTYMVVGVKDVDPRAKALL